MTEQSPQQEGLPLVLLADNGQEDTRWLKRLLETSGYAVLRVRSARHALDRARRTEPDVIVVEAELPDMTGVDLCRTLRGDVHVSNSTPILFAIREPATRAQRLTALRAGAWECITPPHDADEILLKIAAYVQAKRGADRARAEGLLDSNTGLYNRQGLARRARELGAQAFRDHGPLACVVIALDCDSTGTTPGIGGAGDAVTLGRYVQSMKSAARLSDVIGRLGTNEFAVLAPGTDGSGARRLAERLAGSVSGAHAPGATPGAAPVRVRCGYEAVANIGYTPIEPVDLLVRASVALRTGRADSNDWLRRFDEGASSRAQSGTRPLPGSTSAAS
jgi:diguanylate cyclase (GGDEF)-like protein